MLMNEGQDGNGSGRATRFHGILVDRPEHGPRDDQREAPSLLADLRLDQVLEAMTVGREEYRLEPFFHTRLHDADAVRYRHQVLGDLEQPALLECVGAFSKRLRQMREQLARPDKLRYRLQKQRWFLDAVATYCQAVRALAADLAGLDLRSRGFRWFRDYLSGYAGSEAFRSLAADTQAVSDALADVTYSLHIRGDRVTVDRYQGEPDYSAEVERTFARFQQGAVKSYRVRFPAFLEMDHVEAKILSLVGRLYPEAFAALDAHYARHQGYLDQTVATFDQEVQFYLAYLELIAPLRAAGLRFCYPQVSAQTGEVHAVEAFDLALATKLVGERSAVVGNDFSLRDPERILVVTGPNQGGKTTFARMFGQLHYLASLGLPVPGTRARLHLPDRLFTHFEREEDIRTLSGKLEDELLRVRDLLQQATSDSLLVMNESFSSTTLDDALFLGQQVLAQLIESGPRCVYVTFVDELASLGEATVSMVSTVAPDNPAVRTYKIVRRPADGLAYAAAIAERYGLTYQALKRRLAS
jgi:DNA mismatch repair protein MutS